MNIVNIAFKSIKMERFYPKEDKVHISLIFEDPEPRTIEKTIVLSQALGEAEALVKDARSMVKELHKDDQPDPDSRMNIPSVHIVVSNEDDVENQLVSYFGKLQKKIETIKGKNEAEGYLDLIRNVKGYSHEF